MEVIGLKRKVTTIIIISLLLIVIIYQSVRLNDARRDAVGTYKSNIYHLQVVNDIMLDYINTGQYDDVKLQGFSNRCIDLLILSSGLGIPAENYYNRLTKGLIELTDTNNEEDKEILAKEMTFLLESLRELYTLIAKEIYVDINEAYKKIYVSLEVRNKSSEYLASQERSYYK